VSPELVPGSNGVYDIIVEGTTIYSKQQTRQFPDNDEIIKLIKK